MNVANTKVRSSSNGSTRWHVWRLPSRQMEKEFNVLRCHTEAFQTAEEKREAHD